MALVLLTPPAAQPVSVADLKAHLRIDHDEEDERLSAFIAAATSRFDGRDGILGRALLTQQWRLTLPAFAPSITVPLPPCQTVDSITYVDTAGATLTVDASTYVVSGLGGDLPAVIEPAYGAEWPATRTMREAVTVTFTAGYGDDAADTPEPIRAAIRLLAAHLYEHREAVALGATVAELPQGVADLIAPHRGWSF